MSGLLAIMQSNKALAQEDEIKTDDTLGEPSHKKEDDATIIKNYVRVCRHVRKGCNFDIQKCFVDGKPLIIEGSHLEPNLYVDFNQEQNLKIITPNPAEEEEASLENDPIRKMRKTMQAIDQKGSMIIPFLLTISPQNHALCLESKITQEFSHKSENELPKNIKVFVDEQIHKY